MKLYAPFGNFRTNKIMVTAEFLVLGVEQHYVDLQTIKEKEFMKKSPLGKIPILEVYNKGYIFESNAIMRYLARQKLDKGLYGNNDFESSQIDQWLDFCSLELEPAVQQLVMTIQGWIQYVSDKCERAQQDIYNSLRVLEDNFAKNKGNMINSENKNQITLADIAIACVLVNPFRYIFVKEIRDKFILVTQWFQSISTQPAFQKVWGKIWLCEEQFPLNFSIKQQQAKGQQQQQNQQKGSKKDQQSQQKSKPETNQTSNSTNANQNNQQNVVEESKFNLFDFKTLYVNEPDKKKCFDYLWAHFDEQHYSFWKVHYIKAEGDGKVFYMFANLYKGFFQKLDALRKQAFAVHGVYGEEPNLEIRGCWLFQGTEIPQQMKDVDTFEFHTFEKLNVQNPEHKQLIESYWSKQNYQDLVDGMIVQEVKYFK